jgi:hypothetical protein
MSHVTFSRTYTYYYANSMPKRLVLICVESQD